MVLRFFWIFCSLSVQRAANASQPQNRVFSDKLQKHDYLCLRRRDRVPFILLRCQKKKREKIPSLFPYSCTRSPPPLNICPSVTSPLQTAQCNPSHLSTHIWGAIKAPVWSDSILKIMAISQQPEHCRSFVEGEGAKDAERNTREKGYLQGNPFTGRKWDMNWNTFHYSHNLQLGWNASRKAL